MITRNIDCTIQRRLLISYRIDPERAATLVPRPFRPQVINDHAVGGVCLIRMSGLRPARAPLAAGLTTENLAHRFAVEWDDEHGSHTGVYIPRRDTSSRITATLGARIFPGAYHLAKFTVAESPDLIRISVRSRDRAVSLTVAAEPAAALNSRLFASLGEATDFFRHGATGFSPSAADGCLDGVQLRAVDWQARPMTVSALTSSVFDDAAAFPAGTCTVDSALIMTKISARWTADPASTLAMSLPPDTSGHASIQTGP